MDRLERRNRCQTAALTVMAVAFCTVVTMAATEVGRGIRGNYPTDLTKYGDVHMDGVRADDIRTMDLVVMSDLRFGRKDGGPGFYVLRSGAKCDALFHVAGRFVSVVY